MEIAASWISKTVRIREDEMTSGDKIKLRAELAGKAMQGILSDFDTYEAIMRHGFETFGNGVTQGKILVWQSAYMADALMKELGLDGE